MQAVIYTVLRDNLVTTRFPAGVRFREADMARRFGVSRVPVRAALQRLVRDGLLQASARRGFAPTPPGGDDTPPASPLLVIPDMAHDRLGRRNWRQRVFQEAEMTMASVLAFGAFAISEQAMAAHYGFGRGVTREFLSRMQRVGLITQQANGRWRLGPLSARELRDHYTMRQTLEPLALRAAAPKVGAAYLDRQIARLDRCAADVTALHNRDLVRMEAALHRDIVLACDNRIMADAIYRSQLPLISTDIAFVATQSYATVQSTIDQHLAVFQALRGGDVDAAAKRLRDHLASASQSTEARMRRLSPAEVANLPPYLTPLVD